MVTDNVSIQSNPLIFTAIANKLRRNNNKKCPDNKNNNLKAQL